MGLLDGKVGLVTGAAQGLGRATALLAAREGSAVVLADVQEEAGEAAAAAIRAAGGEACFVRCDVSIAADVEKLVAPRGRGVRRARLGLQQRGRRRGRLRSAPRDRRPHLGPHDRGHALGRVLLR